MLGKSILRSFFDPQARRPGTRPTVLKFAMVLVCASLAAQTQPGPDPIAENLFPPELVMAHQKEIGLDDNQKAYLRGEIQKAQAHFTELQWQLQDNMEAMVTALKQSTVDEAQVSALLDKVLNVEREIKHTQITLLVRIRNKLTPEQQARLQKLRGK